MKTFLLTGRQASRLFWLRQAGRPSSVVAIICLCVALLALTCEARTVKRAPDQPAVETALPSHKPQVQGDVVIRTKQQDAELKDWIIGIQTENQKNAQRADAAEASQRQVESDLGKADELADQMQAQLKTLQEERDAAIGRYHRLKALCCFIGAALAVMIVMRFSAIIPPPWNFAAIGGTALFVFGLLWKIL